MHNAFRAIISPITGGIDRLADFVAMLLDFTIMGTLVLNFFEGLASVMEFLGKIVVGLISIFSGLIGGMLEFFMSTGTLNFDKFGSRLKKSFWESFEMIWDDYFDKQKKDMPESKRVQNFHGDININQQFKEQLEPDRIAFALVNTLQKVADNPQQSMGRYFGGHYVQE